MKFSVIVAFKNRDRERVRYFLDSLQWQQELSFEVIFVNQGSEASVNEWLEPLVSTYTFVRYIFNYSEGLLWNKSNALNIGIKSAVGEYVVIADIDVVFGREFLQKVTGYLTPGIFTTHNAFYLTEEFKIKDIATLFPSGPINAVTENFIGVCIAGKDAFVRINGYDEYYLLWGAEDIDIINRLELVGEKRVHLSSKAMPIYHQWHSTNAPAKPSLWYLTMMSHLFDSNATKKTCIDWGKRYLPNDRPVLKLIRENSLTEKFTKIEFWEGQVLLFFNSFLKKFYQLATGEAAFVEYKVDTEVKTQTKGWKLFGKRQIENELISKKDVVDFLQYFIGTNRRLIRDYYLKVEEEKIIFYFIKNQG